MSKIWVGKNIKRLRLLKGWSQSELSRVSEVPQPRISNLENGVTKIGHKKSLEKIAEALGVTIDDLTWGCSVSDLLR